MNKFRQSLEELFNKEEIKQKIKDIEEYYNKGVDDLRNNSIMNKLNELIGIRSAYADDTIPYVPTDYSKYGPGFTREEIDQMNNDQVFGRVVNKTFRNEGGYNNDADDHGGPTKYAISSKTYPNEDIANLTKERAKALLHRDFWKYAYINTLPEDLAYPVFDTAVLTGGPNAVSFAHRAANIPDSPRNTIIGPLTKSNIESMGHDEFLRRYKQNVQNYIDKTIQKDPSQSKFREGWGNRLNTY